MEEARAGAVEPANLARVMICDDSLVIRSALARMLESQPNITVVAKMANGERAIAEMRRQSDARTPIDVVVLDIEMPVMDGMRALPLLLKIDPTVRIIMASTLTTRGADIALQALRLGAADYLPKPGTADIADDSFRRDLIAKILGLARLRWARGRPAAPALPIGVALRALPRQTPRLLVKQR